MAVSASGSLDWLLASPVGATLRIVGEAAGGGRLRERLPALAGQRFAGFVGGSGHVAFIFAGRCRGAIAAADSGSRVGLPAPESPVGAHGRV